MIRSAKAACAWRFGTSKACVYPFIVVLKEAAAEFLNDLRIHS
jgi:hypothetical protein